MLTMQGVAAQGLPHSIPDEAASDHSHTGWTGGFERDGSECYEFRASGDTVIIQLHEILSEEPNEDLPADHPDRWAADKSQSDWISECLFHGSIELFNLGQDSYIPREGDTMRAQARAYDDGPGNADETLSALLLQIPESWLHEALTHRGAVWQGWTESYQKVAGKVTAPMWI